jgi:hypothetical protein
VWESPTWEFFVTPHDSTVDSTRCCVVDVNRDGLPDILNSDGGVWVSDGAGYRATAWAPAPGLLATIGCSRPSLFIRTQLPSRLASLGDVNGDGYGDVALVTGTDNTCGTLRQVILGAYLESGGESGFTVDDRAFAGRSALFQIPELFLFAAGDVNGDGYGDAGTISWEPFSTYASIGVGAIFGAAQVGAFRPGLEGALPAFPLPDSTVAAFGFDCDGDGRHDVAVCTASSSETQVTFITATAVRRFNFPDDTPRLSHGLYFARYLGAGSIGDLNGDGYEDFGVVFDDPNPVPPVHVVTTFRGSPEGYSLPRVSSGDPAWPEGSMWGPLLDVNGDGITDRLVASPPGSAALYLSGPSGFVRGAALPHCTTATVPSCGLRSYFSAGDFNRDGYSDLYVSDANTHVLEIYVGSTAGFGAAPVYTTALPP